MSKKISGLEGRFNRPRRRYYDVDRAQYLGRLFAQVMTLDLHDPAPEALTERIKGLPTPTKEAIRLTAVLLRIAAVTIEIGDVATARRALEATLPGQDVRKSMVVHLIWKYAPYFEGTLCTGSRGFSDQTTTSSAL